MDPHLPSEPRKGPGILAQLFRKPQFLLPMVVVAGMLGVAFGIQPGGAPSTSEAAHELDPGPGRGTETPEWSPSPSPTATSSPETPVSTAAADETATSDVAGVQGTPTVSATPEPDLSRQATECGAIQETTVPLAVEQNIMGVAVRAQSVAVYPVDYLRCILMATGGREAVTLSTALGMAAAQGSTHAVLVDLWVTNGGHEFAQVNLKSASIAAAGQTFAPLATLGGRAEVVVSSGQGRNVTLVGVLRNDVGTTTGPMTVTIEAPLTGGKQNQGKYQLFLPTP
ncbi:MAG: hypothetical protein M0R74_00405 [Dehalococcoidia bacterium]|nr:hypothetical protein [Dehalococcoidia bacterium]